MDSTRLAFSGDRACMGEIMQELIMQRLIIWFRNVNYFWCIYLYFITWLICRLSDWLTDWLSFFLHFYFYLTFSISKQYPSKNKFFHNWGLGVLPNAIYPPGTVPQSWPGLGGEYSSLWYDITLYIFLFSSLLFFWFYIDRIFYSFYIVFIDHFFLYFSHVLIFSIL